MMTAPHVHRASLPEVLEAQRQGLIEALGILGSGQVREARQELERLLRDIIDHQAVIRADEAQMLRKAAAIQARKKQ